MDRDKIYLWLLFLILCFGLGYQGINRYDVRTSSGMGDVRVYYQMTEYGAGWQEPIWLHRALIPSLARPIFLALKGRTLHWNAVYLSLHLWNSFFCSLTALLVYLLGCRLARPPAGLLAALLFLLNFQVSNYVLSGMVDSLQSLALTAMAWFLLRRQWPWVLAAAVLGAAGKETTMALAVILAAGWALATRRDYLWAAATAAAALAATQLMPVLLTGHLSNFLQLADSQKAYDYDGVWKAILGCLTPWNLWLSLGWALPFAWLERRRFPRELWYATLLAVAAAFALGAWSVAGPNTARPVFYLLGPIFSIAAAEWLLGRYGGETAL